VRSLVAVVVSVSEEPKAAKERGPHLRQNRPWWDVVRILAIQVTLSSATCAQVGPKALINDAFVSVRARRC